ncbi:MAG: DHH family phosphoesterase [Clostridia bacterium]
MKSNKYFNSLFKSTSFIYVIVVLVCAFYTFRESVLAGGILFASSLLMLFHQFLERRNRMHKMKQYFDKLTGETLEQNNRLMFNIPDPIAGIRVDGTFAWYNAPFHEAFLQNNFGKKLCEIFPDVHVKDIIADNGIHPVSVQYNGLDYKILPTIVNNTDPEKAAIILYFENMTDVNLLHQMAKDNRPVVMNIMIDNYDETIADAGENEQLEITASIDRILVSWVNDRGGLVRKLEKDRYITVFSHAAFEKIKENRFSVLSDIKNINVMAAAPPTLSIGVGAGGETLADCDNYARVALDMALGRGGDQAAVYDSGKFSYYGGSAKEVEKRTRVKARVMATALKEHILSAENVIIMGHRNADIDAVGAAVGLACAVSHLGKDAKILLNSEDSAVRAVVELMTRNHYHDGLFVSRSQIRDYVTSRSLLIICDTHRPSLTEMPELLDMTEHKVLLDHHRKSESFIDGCELIYHEPAASSTCEMVTEILMYMDGGLSLSTVDATALYAGIILDTKNFVFKTGARTFEAAAFLRNAGVDTIKVKQLFRESAEAYRVRANIVSAARIDERGICVSAVYAEVPQSIISQAADEMLEISGVSASFVVAGGDDGVSISGRSMGDVNVQVIMEELGGGGHAMAAAVQLRSVSVGGAADMLREAIDKYFEKH